MYLQHYGLRELPFSLTPDTSFFFGYGHYRDAFNTLVVALENGEGFIKVTGEVGTGKTLLCRKLLNSLGEEYVTAYIPNPYLTPTALIMAVADELGVSLNVREGTHRALKQITERLIALGAEEKKVVLCIDEAQAMPEQTLETLRLITNLETEKRKLLHVVLFGQPELDERLAQPSARQLRQRITFSYTLQPIDDQGIAAYLQHRLTVAGGNGEVGFDNSAVKLLYRGSGGIPRLINILSHKALLLGFGQGLKRIGVPQVKAAIADTEGVTRQGTGKGQQRYTLLMLLLIVVALGVVVYRMWPLHSWLGSMAGEAKVSLSRDSAVPKPPPRARLSGVTPQRLTGSWQPQQLELHGSSLTPDSRVVASWAGREKVLPAERVEWLDSNTLRLTITTGVRDERWQLQLLHADGRRGEPVHFDVSTKDG